MIEINTVRGSFILSLPKVMLMNSTKCNMLLGFHWLPLGMFGHYNLPLTVEINGASGKIRR